ncbi:MAG: hypothetical protein IJZ35_07800 [Clostridia bacterium]|nr:hypothetical protein [Clostridia bacterium]
MNSAMRKTIKEIKKREKVKQNALEKGWRSRWTLLFKAWAGADRGSHLEWLGFYEEADEIRAKYKFSAKDMLKMSAEVTAGMMTGLANSELSAGGIYDSSKNTLYYGHINNNIGYNSSFKFLAGMFYTVVAQIQIIFGKYKTDAFGLPVRWFKPAKIHKESNII